MADLETLLALEQDVGTCRDLALEYGAKLEPDESDPTVYWLTLHPRDLSRELFFVRIAWTRYPDLPPSVRFAERRGGRLDVATAWPVIPGYRPGSYDICQPFTAEGQALHADWATGPDAWPTAGNPFLWVVGQLLHDMTDRFQGRAA
jgi:hypothetical protein